MREIDKERGRGSERGREKARARRGESLREMRNRSALFTEKSTTFSRHSRVGRNIRARHREQAGTRRGSGEQKLANRCQRGRVLNTHTYMHAYMCIHVQHTDMCIHEHTLMHAYIHTRVYMYTHTYMHTCMFTNQNLRDVVAL